MVNPDTTSYAERLREALRRRAPATVLSEGAHRAAVAVIVADPADPALLVVKRRERVGDPWSGHAALPGGFASANDATLEDTAAREAWEETGLEIARLGPALGRLDDVLPRSVELPRVIVTPVVFAIDSRLPVSASSEVERAAWVRIADLYHARHRGTLGLDVRGERRVFTAIHVDGLSIWGLTERILSQLSQVTHLPR